MRPRWQTPARRRLARIIAWLSILGSAGCGGASAPPSRIDLVAELPRAEKRAIAPERAIRTGLAGPAGDQRMSLLTDAPARITWTLRLPAHAHVTSAIQLVPDAGGHAGAGAAARVGISDNRTYQQLMRLVLDASAPSHEWQPVDVDLSEFSGWKWSLFYQPSRHDWKIVLGVDAAPGGTIAWAHPAIVGR